MAEWTSRMLFGDSAADSDLNSFVAQIEEENNEFMAYEGLEENDRHQKITFEQLSENRILHEIGVDLTVLKNMESMLHERMHAYTLYFNAMGKNHYTVGSEQARIGGSLGLALDALFVFIEQELQQSKQQTLLVDLKNNVIEQRNQCRKKFADYQNHLNLADKNIEVAEKRLLKAREVLEKAIEAKRGVTAPPASVGNKFTRALKNWGTPSTADDRSPSPPHGGPTSPTARAALKGDVSTPDESLIRAKSDVRDAIRNLLKLVETRDNLRIASRRAYYSLDVSSKGVISETIKQLVERERESLDARHEALKKLEAAAEKINVGRDLDAFCDQFAREEDVLVLYSQALLLIGSISEEQKKGISSWNPVEPSASDVATVIAAAHHASGLVTNAETSQLELAESKMAEDRACITANLSDEFSIQFPDALSAAVGSLMPDAAPSAEATLLRLQAEDLHSDSVSTAPKTSFKQKYSDQPGQSLNAESAYEMFHNIFYIAESCTASFSDLINLRGKHRPDGIEDYGTRLCYQEIQLLSDASSTLGGRTILVLVLNQFRSKKVEVGPGWLALGKVLWKLLDNCKTENDVHNAKIVMMLSQTFYAICCSEDDDGSKSNEVTSKLYIKEILLDHGMWKDSRFWEQSLWQCVMEQLQTFQFGGAWYDLSIDDRVEAVKRVHDVAFSQVMAIAHSMMELGCTKGQAREFVYRMCVLHQLSEPQRHMLLSHLTRHEK